MMDSLEEKVAIVTGGGSGIREGLRRELGRRGARVVVADINADDARRVSPPTCANPIGCHSTLKPSASGPKLERGMITARGGPWLLTGGSPGQRWRRSPRTAG